MNTEWLNGSHCVVHASRTSDRRFWYCCMGCVHTNHEGVIVCDYSCDWLAVCDDFGNLVPVSR